jgi:hypothetical protein
MNGADRPDATPAPFEPGPTDAAAGPWCVDGGTTWDLEPLRPRVIELLSVSTGSTTTSAVAVALGVPFWVADVLLDSMQEQGDTLHGPLGWRLSASALQGLHLSLPPALRRLAEGGAA